MVAYLQGIWRCRYFWLSLAKLDVQKRYRRTFLGVGWAYVQPVAMTLVSCTIFCKLFEVPIWDYIPTVLIGLCFWNYLTSVIMQGCGSIFWSETYIRQQRVPLAVYPLRIVLANLFYFVLVLFTIIGFEFIRHGPNHLTALFSLLPSIFLLALLGWALATILGFVNIYFPDTQHAMEFGLQILFYVTPILYSPQMLRKKNISAFMDYNPLSNLVELIREPILAGHAPSLLSYGLAALTVLLMGFLAILLVACLERKVIFRM